MTGSMEILQNCIVNICRRSLYIYDWKTGIRPGKRTDPRSTGKNASAHLPARFHVVKKAEARKFEMRCVKNDADGRKLICTA